MEEKETATKLEFLEWFYCYADFGPADGDVRQDLKLNFIEETNKNIPKGFNYMSDGETDINEYYKENYEK